MDNIDSLVIENPNPEKKHNEYQIVFLLAFVSFLCTTDSMLLMPLSDVLMKHFNISALSSTWVISVYSIFAGISGFLSASIMDRFDRKRLLIGTFIGFTIGTLLCGYAADYWLFVFCRGITGVFGGIVGGVGVAIVSDLIPYRRRATAMSIISLAFAVAAITGVPLGIHLAENYGLALPFKILAFISAVTLIPIILWLPKVDMHLIDHIDFHDPLRTITKTMKDPNQVWALGLSIILVFSHFVVLQFIKPYMVNNVGFSPSLVPIMYAFGGVCAIATAPLVGKLSDSKGNLPSFIGLMFLSFIPIIISTHMRQANIVVAFAVCSLFFILVAGRMIPAYTLMSGATTPEKRGAFMSMRSACLEFGTALASLSSGFIVKIGSDGIVHHFNWVGYLSVLTGLLCIFMASRIRIVSHN